MKIRAYIRVVHNWFWKVFSGYVEDTFMDRQRLLVLIYLMIINTLVMVLRQLGLTGMEGGYFDWGNNLYYVLCCSACVLFLLRLLSLTPTLVIVLLGCLMFNIFHMFYIALFGIGYAYPALVGSVMMMMVTLFLAILSYLKKLTLVIAALSVTAYAVCCLLTRDAHITGIFAGVVGVFVLVWLMGTRLIELLTELSKTNDEMKVTQREIFSLFRMDKAALLSVAHLAGKQDLSPQQTGKLLERIADPEDEEQVDRDLAGWYEQHRTDASLLEQVFPMLSPSQREICKLIVEGYKLREICEVLGKTESNVTCQRSNIRARLQLDKADNLREVLQARLDAYVRTHSPKS